MHAADFDQQNSPIPTSAATNAGCSSRGGVIDDISRRLQDAGAPPVSLGAARTG